MNCPNCNHLLKNIKYEGQSIDICENCAGLWFDEDEFRPVINSLISNNRVSNQTIKEAYRIKSELETVDTYIRKCPKCKIDMHTFNYCHDSNVFLDKCPSCKGVWADKGELRQAAKHIKGNPSMNNYAKALIKATKKYPNASKISKLSALFVACIYLIGSLYYGGEIFLRTLMYLIWPIAFIFFGEELGSLTGIRFRLTLAAPVVTKPTPGIIVVFIGWVMLLIPLAIAMYKFIAG